MSHFVYILHSQIINKFYVGETSDLEKRLIRHNTSQVRWTKRGLPWRVFWSKEVLNRSEGRLLERKIKSRGAKRYLQDQNLNVPQGLN